MIYITFPQSAPNSLYIFAVRVRHVLLFRENMWSASIRSTDLRISTAWSRLDLFSPFIARCSSLFCCTVFKLFIYIFHCTTVKLYIESSNSIVRRIALYQKFSNSYPIRVLYSQWPIHLISVESPLCSARECRRQPDPRQWRTRCSLDARLWLPATRCTARPQL